MKKLVVIILLAVCFAPAAQGQVLMALLFGDKLNSERLSFGLNLGMNSTILTNIDEAKFDHNFTLGLYFDIKLKKNPAWSIHPGVDIKNNFGARHIFPYEVGDPSLDTLLSQSLVTRKFNMIYTFATMRYTTRCGFGFEGGTQIGLLVKAFDHFERSKIAGSNDKFTYSIKNPKKYQRIDVAFRGGVFYKIPKGRGVFINLNCQYGMIDMPKNNTGDPMRNLGIQWAVSIPVGVKKPATDDTAEPDAVEPAE